MQWIARRPQFGVALLILGGALLGSDAMAQALRVQDVARLGGTHANRFAGFGLVVGLPGTGDGNGNVQTQRALAALHGRYEQNVLDAAALDASNVALVKVEVTAPDAGWRRGDRADVVVSALGASSLAGGQLLMTPMQVAPLPLNPTQAQSAVWCVAGGRIDLPQAETPTRGVIIDGATFEMSMYYQFVEGGAFELVIDEAQSSFGMADVVAGAINARLQIPTAGSQLQRDASGRPVQQPEYALAIDPRTVRVEIPAWERPYAPKFIARVMDTELFELPSQQARVTINRTQGQIVATGPALVVPTVIQVPGYGTLTIEAPREVTPAEGGATSAPEDAPAQRQLGTPLSSVLEQLETLNLPPERMVRVVEDLHASGALKARLAYTQ